MKLFHNKEQYQGYNMYSMKKYVDKKRIIFISVVIILSIIALGFSLYYIIDTSIRVKASKEFVAQVEDTKRIKKF